MKKFTALLFTLCLASLGLSSAALARNNVSSIDIEVALSDDGGAYVTQIWNGTFQEGTENYIVVENLDGMEISGFLVSDADGPYALQPSWDVKAGFDAKSRKCGIVKTDNGYELCFGISAYGENRYAVEYKIHNMAGGYSDYDGFNFMFINPGMSTFPTDGKIRVLLQNGEALDETNAGIWGFGYDGQIEFQNGSVVAYTQSPLRGKNSMIVMLRLNKGLIHPQRTVGGSFERLQKKALAGSDYNAGEDNPWLGTVFLTVLGLVVLALLLAAVSAIRRKKAIRKFYKNAAYFRDIPNGGNTALSHYLCQSFDMSRDESAIIGACLLKMIHDHHIEPAASEKSGFFGKTKTSVTLRLVTAPEDALSGALYQILVKAAGEDGALQEKELETYARKNPDRLRAFIEQAKKTGEGAFVSLGGFADKKRLRIERLSQAGRVQLSEIMGLKKFLLDFSLISERGIREVVIWQDYLVCAALLGIADKVMAQFKKVYPGQLAEMEGYERNLAVAYAYHRSMYSAMKSGEQAARASGGGGSSSIGGGGGFSGGGSGGGSR